jgi:hypothetical protein
VFFQIAEGCGEAFAAGEEVLVDAQDLRTSRRMPFFELALEPFAKIAFDRGGADFLAPSEAAAVDTVEVLLVDGLLISFTASLAGKDASEALAEVAAAIAASPLGDLQFQDAGSLTPILVTDPSEVVAFIP